jgi:lipoate-protein ligase A
MDVLRVIRDPALPGTINMDRDRALFASQRPDDPPVLRVYRWSPPAISIGYNQRAEDFGLLGSCGRTVALVRRPTGGRAILHADELTYAVVGASPSPLFGPSLHTTYSRINRALLAFLSGLEIAAEISSGESRAEARGAICFQSAGQHEIRVAGRKLIGSAQRRSEGLFLQHGSILTGPGHADLSDYLAGPRKAGSRRALLAATTDLGRLLGRPLAAADLDALAERLVAAFAQALGLRPQPYRP